MKTICTNIMRETESGAARSAEMERHLAECPDCALFHRISTLEHDTSGIQVPEQLDTVILAEARRYAARRRWRVWKIAVPVAASFLVSFGIAFYSLLPAPASPNLTATATQSASLSDYDDSLISLSCEVASGASLIASAYEISNQGVQTI